MELVKLLPVHQYSVNIFHVLVLQEYWVLTESRIPLKLVLRGVRIVAFSYRLKKTKYAVSNIVGSLYL